MRLSRLDLARYGRFTDASVRFDAPAEGTCDLHILYGDNEAGKTTAYNAMLDLLFGIEPKTSYGWLHPLATMRVAGAIEGAGGSREVVRLGRTRGLLDAAEHPSMEGPVPSELAGMDRETYRQMFSLDEKTLAAGGESILKAEGNLGELLFSATAGLAEFSKALAGLRAESEAFFKTHGRKHALAEFKKRLVDLKERRAAIDVLATTYVRLTSARDAAKEAYDRAAIERVRLRAELDQAGRHAAAWPRLAEVAAARCDLEALPCLPAAPAAWRADLPELQRAEVEARTRHDGVSDEIRRLTVVLGAPLHDAVAMEIAPLVSMAAVPRARHATAVKDLPGRRILLQRERAAIAAIARDLGRDEADASALPLPDDTVDALREAMEVLSGIQARCDEADAEVAQSRQRLALAKLDCEPGGERPLARDALVTALGVLQGDDVEGRVRLARRDHAGKADVLHGRLAELAPWRGAVEDLAAMSLPSQRCRESLAERQTAASAEVERRDSNVARLEDEVARHRARHDALARCGGLVDDAAAAASRATRDRAWSRHLDAMDDATALVFERVMRVDDETGANRLSQADAVAQLRTLDLSLATATAELTIARGRADEARRRRDQASSVIGETLASLPGGERDWTLDRLEDFAAARLRALEAHDDLRRCGCDLANALEDRDRVRAKLAQAVEAAGRPRAAEADMAALALEARGILDADALRRERDDLVQRFEHESSDRERQAQKAGRDRAEWDEAWRHRLRGTWLPPDAGVALVRSVLKRLDALAPALARHDDLAERIAKMELDEATFAATVAGCADAMAIDKEDEPIAAILRTIDRRIEAARDEEATRKARSLDLEAARTRLAALSPELDALMARKEEMTTRLGVASLADVALALETAVRREALVERIGAMERDVTAVCASRSFAEAETELAAMDPRTLADRRIELTAQCEDQDQLTQQRFADLGRAREALGAVDGDAAAARLDEERRTVLLEIEEGTLSHLALQAGIVSAEVAVRLFRERHRSSMMASASDVFRKLTRGAYDGLVAQGGGGGEVLVGIAAEGGSRLSHEMSVATRNQLYLSLRVAGYGEYAKTRRPPPFVLDDVLETFDDRRAEAALVQLHAMSGIGQVVYLTHHRHLCEIARRACPGATIRELASR